MEYKSKYDKYKKKYLQLFEQQGGVGKDFYVYTTGISDWVNTNTIIKQWRHNGVRQHLLSLIPAEYTDIHILHSDTLESDAGDKPYTYDDRKRAIDTINSTLIVSDMMVRRVVSSVFTVERLDFDTIKDPHIILDYANILKQDKISEIMIGYNEQFITIGLTRDTKLNIVNMPYFGEEQCDSRNGLCNLFLPKSQYFQVIGGEPITYIEKMEELGYFEKPQISNEQNKPNDFSESSQFQDYIYSYIGYYYNSESKLKNGGIKKNKIIEQLYNLIKDICAFYIIFNHTQNVSKKNDF
jgi:hypothetical protein